MSHYIEPNSWRHKYVRVLYGEHKEYVHYYIRQNWAPYFYKKFGKVYFELKAYHIPFTQWYICKPKGFMDWALCKQPLYLVYKYNEQENIEIFLNSIKNRPEIPLEDRSYLPKNFFQGNLVQYNKHVPVAPGEKYESFMHDYFFGTVTKADIGNKFIKFFDNIAFLIDFVHNIKGFFWWAVNEVYLKYMRLSVYPRAKTYDLRVKIWNFLVKVWDTIILCWNYIVKVWDVFYSFLETIINAIFFILSFEWFFKWFTKAWARYLRVMKPMTDGWQEAYEVVNKKKTELIETVGSENWVIKWTPDFIKENLFKIFKFGELNIMIPINNTLLALQEYTLLNYDESIINKIVYYLMIQISVYYNGFILFLTQMSFTNWKIIIIEKFNSKLKNFLFNYEITKSTIYTSIREFNMLISEFLTFWHECTIAIDTFETKHTYLRNYMGVGREWVFHVIKYEFDPEYWMTTVYGWKIQPVIKQAVANDYFVWTIEKYLRIPTVEELIVVWVRFVHWIYNWFGWMPIVQKFQKFCNDNPSMIWLCEYKGYVFLWWNFVILTIVFFIGSVIVDHSWLRKRKEEAIEVEVAKIYAEEGIDYYRKKAFDFKPLWTEIVWSFITLGFSLTSHWFKHTFPDMNKKKLTLIDKAQTPLALTSAKILKQDAIRERSLWTHANNYIKMMETFNENRKLIIKYNQTSNMLLILMKEQKAVDSNYNVYVRGFLLLDKSSAPIIPIERALLNNVATYMAGMMTPIIARNWSLIKLPVEFFYVSFTPKELKKRKKYLKANPEKRTAYDDINVGMRPRPAKFYDLEETKAIGMSSFGGRTDMPDNMRKSTLIVFPNNEHNRRFGPEVAEFFEQAKTDGLLNELFHFTCDKVHSTSLVFNQDPRVQEVTKFKLKKDFDLFMEREKLVSMSDTKWFFIFRSQDNFVIDQFVVDDNPDGDLYKEAEWVEKREL